MKIIPIDLKAITATPRLPSGTPHLSNGGPQLPSGAPRLPSGGPQNIQEIEIGEDSELKGIFVGKDNQQVKTKFIFTHKKPNTKSRITIKAVLYDNSKFDFEGILKIEKGAENTDSYLKIDCLVMGAGASARAIPSLEIKESAVKAGHGATIGYLDQNLLYYLKSKGLSDKQSEELIVEAFIQS